MTRTLSLAVGVIVVLALPGIGRTASAEQIQGSTDRTAQALRCDPDRDADCVPLPDRGEKCLSVTARPPVGSRRYSCQFTVTDSYERPAANTAVTIETRWCNRAGSEVRESGSSATDAQGRATITITSPSANVIECGIDGGFFGSTPVVRKSNTALPTGTRVTMTRRVLPRPTATRSVPGTEAGEGRMDLYQSGAYDKVLLIAEQFDQFEHGFLNRERSRFWKQLSTLLTRLFVDGWDVWLVQPHDTGESLHEQAAEFAQAIAAARRPTLLCPTPQVGVLGFNTGGLVARIATARWEADPAWRAQLGLPTTLPASFVATYDAPHYGMHLNLDMQHTLWDNRNESSQIRTETNLDSCAASQVLRGRFDPVRGRKTNADFLAFFVKGTPSRFFSMLDNKEHACAAGPAVATLNAARGVPGWPSTPRRLGFTQSSATDRTKCDPGPDANRNGSGQDLCKFVSELGATPFTPTAGQTWLRLFIDDPSLPDLCSDVFWNAEERIEWSDITPGSRSPLFIDGFVGQGMGGPFICKAFAHQRFPVTLVPFVSAAGTQGPQGASNYASLPSPFHELHPAARSRVANVIDLFDGIELLNRLNAFAPTCQPPVVTPK